MHKRYSKVCCVVLVMVALSFMMFSAGIVNNLTKVIEVNRLEQRVPCIIIDPGHGGIDGGAISCTGVYESQINLEISLRLNDLMRFLGYRTKMTREEDISVYKNGNTIAEKKISDLKERVKLVNQTDNAILISIHQNYFQDSKYKGAQVFYAPGSQDLATTVQSYFVNSINYGSKRKTKKADGIYLMEKIKCTGILVECGFLSNQAEAHKLQGAEYQKRVCCVIAAATSCYINNKAIA